MKTDSLKDLMQCPRQFANLILAGMFISLISSAAMAQTPAPPQQQAQQQTTFPSPESPPIPERSIGLEPGKVVQWTLKDAILAALDNNVDIETERTNVREAQWNVVAAQGVYDPSTTSRLNYSSQTSPNLNQFTGATADSIVSNEYQYTYGFQQQIEKTGGTYEIDFTHARDANNRDQVAVNYSPSLSFNISQPLFRNFKTDTYRNTIKINKKKLDISDAVFRQRVIQIITNVQTAYWQLYIAYENEKTQRSSLALAEKQLSDNKRQVEVGTLAPIDIIQAAAVVENDRAAVYNAINQVASAENALKVLVVDGPNSDLWKTKIETIQKFEIKNVELPLDDALKLAMANRYELKQYNLQKESNKYNIDFFRNQAKPQINFVANYTLGGLGGTPRQVLTAPNCNPVTVNNQPTCLTLVPTIDPNGVPVPVYQQTPFQPSVLAPAIQLNPKYLGGYGTSLKTLFSNDFNSWSVGFQFQLPLRNRIAKANLAIAREQDKATDLAIRSQMQQIELQVRNAVQQLDTAKQRVETTHKATDYAEQQYEGAQKKLTAGLAQVFEVLTRQNDLVQAQVQENQAKSDYAVAVANLEMVLSTADVNNGIQIPDPKVPVK
ncbi:MAG: TolC family protein [Blastocatellia bacterium]|nr:TolC family protein [Blastocatellia bacterium]